MLMGSMKVKLELSNSCKGNRLQDEAKFKGSTHMSNQLLEQLPELEAVPQTKEHSTPNLTQNAYKGSTESRTKVHYLSIYF